MSGEDLFVKIGASRSQMAPISWAPRPHRRHLKFLPRPRSDPFGPSDHASTTQRRTHTIADNHEQPGNINRGGLIPPVFGVSCGDSTGTGGCRGLRLGDWHGLRGGNEARRREHKEHYRAKRKFGRHSGE